MTDPKIDQAAIKNINGGYMALAAGNYLREKDITSAKAAMQAYVPPKNELGQINPILARSLRDFAEAENPYATTVGRTLADFAKVTNDALKGASIETILNSTFEAGFRDPELVKRAIAADGDKKYGDQIKAYSKLKREADDAETKMNRTIEDSEGDKDKMEAAQKAYNDSMKKIGEEMNKLNAFHLIHQAQQARFAMTRLNANGRSSYGLNWTDEELDAASKNVPDVDLSKY